MIGDNRAHDRKAQTGTTALRGEIWFEDAILIRRRNSRSVVSELKDRPPTFSIEGKADTDRAGAAVYRRNRVV
jgi:hypothetical protein